MQKTKKPDSLAILGLIAIAVQRQHPDWGRNRLVQFIEDLDPARRGTYGGAVLYADFSGNLDSCIAIRSLLSKDGKGSVQAGAGIVADSVPELEHQESLNKAQAVIRAIEHAREL